jgi:hypothetical protein
MKKLFKNKVFQLSLMGCFVFLLGAGAVFTYANAEGVGTQEKIKALLEKLRFTSQQEMKNGIVVSTVNGDKFSGTTSDRMEKMHSEVQKQIDDLVARPEAERREAIEEIKKFSKDQKVEVVYKQTSKASLNSEVPIEVYVTPLDQYEIDISNNKVIQYGSRPLAIGEKAKEFDYDDRFSPKELEQLARQFIRDNAPEVNLDKLIANHGNKDSLNYFFRWEDLTREVEGMHPFVQVGFSRGGSLLSYTNSIGL